MALKQDSQCEQHMINDPAYFPFGVSPTPHVKVKVADGRLVDTGGEGTAVVVHDATGEIIVMHNSLLTPELDESLASVEQSFSQAGAQVRFGPHCDIVFVSDSSSEGVIRLPLEAGYTLSVRPPTAEEIHTISVTFKAPISDSLPGHTLTTGEGGKKISARCSTPQEARVEALVTRGKSAGGPASKLPAKELGDLWGARLNLPAARLRTLPEITADAPAALSRLQPGMIVDEARLGANAPRIHPAPVSRPLTDHPGQRTCTDLIGPLPPSKWGGNRYAANFVDVHTGEYDPAFLRTKDQYPERLKTYYVHNEGRDGCTFAGGTMYSDNEIMLNSKLVYDVSAQYGVTLNNSCEYEPWQNGIPERAFRSLTDSMRTDHERGNAGDEYWPFSMSQAAHISKRTGHAWGGDDDRTPFERRTGRAPVLSDIRPMFCLAFVRRPPALREGKLAAQADRCMHLGNARTKPGYAFEVLEGSRKGKLIYSSQAVFRETVFPLRETTPPAPIEDTELEMLSWSDEDEDEDEQETDTTMPGINDDDGSDDEDEGGDVHQPRYSSRKTSNPFALGRANAPSMPQTVFAGTTPLGSTVRGVYSTCVDASLVEAPEPSPARSVPKSFDDIKNMRDPERWYEAHYHENDRLFVMPDGRGLTAVPRRAGDTVLPIRTIYTEKASGDAKARTTLGGHRMVAGRDYFETFSPTIKYTTVRAFLAAAATRNDVVTRGDDEQAYLQADRPDGANGKPNRAQMPKGYESVIDGVEHVVEVGNLYGGPPAGRYWYKCKITWLKDYGFKQSEWDPCLFTLKRADGAWLRLILYVDDFLAAHTRGSDIRDEFAEAYTKRFLWTDYGTELGEFLSINICQTEGGITIDSERYITDLAAEFFPGGVHAAYELPSTEQLTKLVKEAAAAKVVPEQTLLHRFASLVMKELFVSTVTRPEVAWSVAMLSRVLAYPTAELMLAAERIAIYLYKYRALKIKYEPSGANVRGAWAPRASVAEGVTEGLSDASFEIAHSTLGYVYLFAMAAIAWIVKKQKSIALSSFEAEIMAGSLAACEGVFLRGIFGDLGFPQDAPTLLRIDNSGAIDVANDPVNHANSKHILRRELHIRELIEAGVIVVKYVKSADNTADVLTKHLDRAAFQKHRKTLYNNSI